MMLPMNLPIGLAVSFYQTIRALDPVMAMILDNHRIRIGANWFYFMNIFTQKPAAVAEPATKRAGRRWQCGALNTFPEHSLGVGELVKQMLETAFPSPPEQGARHRRGKAFRYLARAMVDVTDALQPSITLVFRAKWCSCCCTR